MISPTLGTSETVNDHEQRDKQGACRREFRW